MLRNRFPLTKLVDSEPLQLNRLSSISTLAFALTGLGTSRQSAGTLRFEPVSIALLRLRYLHHAAIGSTLELPPRQGKINPEQTFQNTIESELGSVIAASAQTRTDLLGWIVKFVTRWASFDGVESIFLSLLVSAAGLASSETFYDQALELWTRIGPPADLGGGLPASLVFSADTGKIAVFSASALQRFNPGRLAGNGPASATDMSNAITAAATAIYGPAQIEATGDTTETICKDVFRIGSVIAGVVLGKAGGPVVGQAASTAVAAGGEALCSSFTAPNQTITPAGTFTSTTGDDGSITTVFSTSNDHGSTSTGSITSTTSEDGSRSSTFNVTVTGTDGSTSTTTGTSTVTQGSDGSTTVTGESTTTYDDGSTSTTSQTQTFYQDCSSSSSSTTTTTDFNGNQTSSTTTTQQSTPNGNGTTTTTTTTTDNETGDQTTSTDTNEPGDNTDVLGAVLAPGVAFTGKGGDFTDTVNTNATVNPGVASTGKGGDFTDTVNTNATVSPGVASAGKGGDFTDTVNTNATVDPAKVHRNPERP